MFLRVAAQPALHGALRLGVPPESGRLLRGWFPCGPVSRMKQLHELKIQKFRNVLPTTLKFRRGLNVVLGKNAAGKTSLLTLATKLLNLQLRTPEDEVSSTEHVIIEEAAENRATLTRKIEVTSGDDQLWGYEELAFLRGTNRVGLELAGGVGRLTDPPNPAPLAGPELLNAIRQQLGASYGSFRANLETSVFRLDESLEHFGRLSRLSVTRTRAPSWCPQELIPSTESLAHDEFAPSFVAKAAHAMGYERGSVRFDDESSGTEKYFTNYRYFFERGRSRTSHKHLSYGEQRMLAFFAASAACPEIVIADELVNGLHHEWIKSCVDEIGSRQAFLTSQNPLLLDYLEFESPEDVQTGLVLCSRQETPNGPALIWRNPTEQEADEFFRSYKTGIQSVSDILISKGMW